MVLLTMTFVGKAQLESPRRATGLVTLVMRMMVLLKAAPQIPQAVLEQKSALGEKQTIMTG